MAVTQSKQLYIVVVRQAVKAITVKTIKNVVTMASVNNIISQARLNSIVAITTTDHVRARGQDLKT